MSCACSELYGLIDCRTRNIGKASPRLGPRVRGIGLMYDNNSKKSDDDDDDDDRMAEMILIVVTVLMT